MRLPYHNSNVASLPTNKRLTVAWRQAKLDPIGSYLIYDIASTHVHSDFDLFLHWNQFPTQLAPLTFKSTNHFPSRKLALDGRRDQESRRERRYFARNLIWFKPIDNWAWLKLNLLDIIARSCILYLILKSWNRFGKSTNHNIISTEGSRVHR